MHYAWRSCLLLEAPTVEITGLLRDPALNGVRGNAERVTAVLRDDRRVNVRTENLKSYYQINVKQFVPENDRSAVAPRAPEIRLAPRWFEMYLQEPSQDR